MTKFSLTVNTDNPQEIQAILAALGSGASVPTIPTADEDDETPPPVGVTIPATDATGLPWDERIHSASKATVKDGTWRKKKGVDAATIAQVESELRARAAGPVPTQQPQPQQPAPVQQPPFAPAQPGFPSQPAMTAPVQVEPAVSMPAQSQVTAPTPQQPAQTLDFNGLMMGMQKGMQAGKIDVQVLTQLVSEINTAWGSGLTTITDLAQPQNAHMVPWVKDLIASKGLWID